MTPHQVAALIRKQAAAAGMTPQEFAGAMNALTPEQIASRPLRAAAREADAGGGTVKLLAIDPGPVESAYVLWDGERIERHQKAENALLCDAIMTQCVDADKMVIEKIASYGMAVGEEVFETVFWSGRFAQAFYAKLRPVFRVTRGAVKMHLCQSMRAKDANIRQALLDRFGGKERAVGKKASPGPLYGVSGDEWAALAVAVTWWDQNHADAAGGQMELGARG